MAASSYTKSDTLVTTQLTPTYGMERLLIGDITVNLENVTAQTLYTAPDDGNNRFVTKVVLRSPSGDASESTGTFGSDVLATNWGSFSLVDMASAGNYFGMYIPSINGDSEGLSPLDTFNLIVKTPSAGVTCKADLFGFVSKIGGH